MGLIQQANSLHNVESPLVHSKKKIGLLSRITHASSYDLVLDSFRDYLDNIHAERGGLLYPTDDGYSVLLLNTGFDFSTVHRFCPQITMMNRLLAGENNWYTFTKSGIEEFHSFFSSRERESLTTLYIHPITTEVNSACYLILAESTLNIHRVAIDIGKAKSILPDLTTVVNTYISTITALSLKTSVNQSYNSMKTHTESALDSKRTATLARFSFSELFPDTFTFETDSDSQAVYFAIVHRMARQAGNSNIIFIRKNYNLHVVLFTALPVDTELYFYQLMKPLEKIFGASRISRIKAEKIGTSDSVSSIMDFLTGEV